jgi:proline dehydrogenase
MAGSLRGLIRKGWMAVARRAARGYIAGEDLSGAIRASLTLAECGIGTTIGYWNRSLEPPGNIVKSHLNILEQIAKEKLDAYLSVKAPPLGFSSELVRQIVDRAGLTAIRVHFDSHGPEAADDTIAVLRDAAAHLGRSPSAARSSALGLTLPGRWRRSLSDADHAVELGLAVRVVKGQWADPEEPGRDMRDGFLEIVNRLAGRAQKVAVATHDEPLARSALLRLRSAGTPCELELLYGLPIAAGLRLSRELQIPVRMYIPFGSAWLPYALSQVKANPRVCWWILRDFATGRAFRIPKPTRSTRLVKETLTPISHHGEKSG